MKKALFFALALFLGSHLMAQVDTIPLESEFDPNRDNYVVNPLNHGLRQAKDGIERFRVLEHTHQIAVRHYTHVSYAGIDTLRLVIPEGAEPIPLPMEVDFANVVIDVTNTTHNVALFARVQTAQEIEVTKEQVAAGKIEKYPGQRLLILCDQTPWVAERKGYAYPAMRKDIVFVDSQGYFLSQPVTSYSSEATSVKAYVFFHDWYTKRYSNLTLLRNPQSTFITYCIRLQDQSDVQITNMHVVTPKSKLTADAVFSVSNCFNVRFADITVDGTYSLPGKYGYAFSMNNVLGSEFIRVKADGNWGVFGTNNMNNTYLEECDINRFDIHCYGRDVFFHKCTFRNKQTQFGSFYGSLVFDSCQFIDCIPVRVRASYNAYTPFDITIHDCTFEATRRHHALVNMMLNADPQQRPELMRKCWPNITIDGLAIISRGAGTLYILDPTEAVSECRKPAEYLSQIRISNIKADKKTKIILSSRDIHTAEPFRLESAVSDPHITIINNISQAADTPKRKKQ